MIRLRLAPLLVAMLVGITSPSSVLSQETDEGGWSAVTYQELADEIRSLDSAREDAVAGSPDHVALTEASLQARRELVAYLSRALASGDVPEGLRAPALNDRVMLVQNVIVLLTELQRCSDAHSALGIFESAVRQGELASDDGAELIRAARSRVEECELATVAATPNVAEPTTTFAPPATHATHATSVPATNTFVGPGTGAGAASEAHPRRRRGAPAMLVISAAATAGGGVWTWLAQSDVENATDEYESYLLVESDPTVEGHDALRARGRELESRRNIAVGVTAGFGVVTAVLIGVVAARGNDQSPVAQTNDRPTRLGFVAGPRGVGLAW